MDHNNIVDQLSKEGLEIMENNFVILEGFQGCFEKMRRIAFGKLSFYSLLFSSFTHMSYN